MMSYVQQLIWIIAIATIFFMAMSNTNLTVHAVWAIVGKMIIGKLVGDVVFMCILVTTLMCILSNASQYKPERYWGVCQIL